jgi:hypothetical protein
MRSNAHFYFAVLVFDVLGTDNGHLYDQDSYRSSWLWSLDRLDPLDIQYDPKIPNPMRHGVTLHKMLNP